MRGRMGTGTILKLVAGIWVGMGIRVTGTVGDGYKYLSPCSSVTHLLFFVKISGPKIGVDQRRSQDLKSGWAHGVWENLAVPSRVQWPRWVSAGEAP